MSRAAVKDLGMLVDEGLYMTWQKACSARAASVRVSQQVMGRDSALLPYSVRPQLECCMQLLEINL